MRYIGGMKTHGRGNNLKIEIKLALLSLKRETNLKLNRLTIAELQAVLHNLRLEQIKYGIIKPHRCAISAP